MPTTPDSVSLFTQGNGHFRGRGVLLNVQQGFPEDAVECQLPRPWQTPSERQCLLQPPAGFARQLLEIPLHRGDQAKLIQDRRLEVVHDIAGFPQDVPGKAGAAHHSLVDVRVRPGQTLDRLELVVDRGQGLGDPVVHLQGYPLPLLVVRCDRSKK